jgi:hypothetical protein
LRAAADEHADVAGHELVDRTRHQRGSIVPGSI